MAETPTPIEALRWIAKDARAILKRAHGEEPRFKPGEVLAALCRAFATASLFEDDEPPRDSADRLDRDQVPEQREGVQIARSAGGRDEGNDLGSVESSEGRDSRALGELSAGARTQRSGPSARPDYLTPSVSSDASGAPTTCGKIAASWIPRLGMSFACALPLNHEGACRAGGTCFTHGDYVSQSPLTNPVCPHCLTGSEPTPSVGESGETFASLTDGEVAAAADLLRIESMRGHSPAEVYALSLRTHRRLTVLEREREEMTNDAEILHALIRPDNGYCNQCGGAWLYRVAGDWSYFDGEHTPDCIGRRVLERHANPAGSLSSGEPDGSPESPSQEVR